MTVFADLMNAQRFLAGVNSGWGTLLDEVQLKPTQQEQAAGLIDKITTNMNQLVDLLREAGGEEKYTPKSVERRYGVRSSPTTHTTVIHTTPTPPATKPMGPHPWREKE